MKAEESATEIVTPRKIKIKEEIKECESQEILLSYDQDLPPNIPTTTIISSTITPSAVKTSTVAINNSSISTKLPATAIDNTNPAVSFVSKESLSDDVKNKAVLSSVNQSQEDVSKEALHDCEDNTSSSSNNCLLKPKQLSDNEQQRPSAVGVDNGQMYSSSSTDNLRPKTVSIKVEEEDPSMTDGTNKTEENLTISEINNTCDSSQSNNLGSAGIKSITSIFAGHTKLKRLLGTLVQFANNISNEVGDTVRTLIFGLLSGGLAIEEFHTSLQEATNFPLKDFVLPYLKHTLPLLRRNITAAARSNNQTSVQYLRCNESALLETISLVVPSGEIVQLFGDYNSGTSSNYGIRSTSITSNSNSFLQSSNSFSTVSLQDYSSSGAIKRRASDTLYHENGIEDPMIYGKRSISSWNHSHHQHQQQQSPDSYCWYHPSVGNTIQNNSQTSVHGNSLIPPNLVQINQMSYSSYHGAQQQQQQQQHHQQQQQQQQQLNHMTSSVQNNSSLDDEWKNIHVMLNCILGMVEKTKRALVILQKRGSSSPAGSTTAPSANASTVITQNQNNGNNLNCLNGSQVEGGSGDRDSNLKRLSGEIVAQTIRATEDRVTAEVKRRAEEAVQEVKRAAMAEVQRAVAIAVAESRANERFRAHQPTESSFLPLKNHGSIRQGPFFRLNNHSINQSVEITSKINAATTINSSLSREDDKEMHLSSIGFTCWNCGRPALETCGGCGIARYCSSFCQHRDWETGGHHANCRHNSPSTSESRRSSPRSPLRVVNLNQNDIIGGSSDSAPNLPINITKAK